MEQTDTKKNEDWVWLGHKQHFIGKSSCRFSLATYLPATRRVVSTIGDYFPVYEREAVGPGTDDYYETFVFICDGTFSEYCGCPTRVDTLEIDGRRYATAQEATAGHMELCRKHSEV